LQRKETLRENEQRVTRFSVPIPGFGGAIPTWLVLQFSLMPLRNRKWLALQVLVGGIGV